MDKPYNMLEGFFGKVIFGNYVLQYIIYFLILFGVFYFTKLIYFTFVKIFKNVAKKTKTHLDDLLLDALEKPFLFFIFTLGFHYARVFLTLSEKMDTLYSNTLFIFYVWAIVWFVLRIVDSIILNYFHPKSTKSVIKIDNTLYPLLKKLVNFLILAVAFLIIIQNMGYQITSLIAGLGIGGLALALAAQDILSNLFAGVAILTDKPFKVEDRILVAGQDGFVKRIGLRTTIIETWGGTQVVMPNKQVADSVLENITREKARRVRMVLGVEYSTSTKKLEKAKNLLKQIVLKNKSTDDNCLVHFTDFGDSSLDIQLIYWIQNLDNILNAKDEVNFEIKKAFEKEKIEFAFPSQTLYLKK